MPRAQWSLCRAIAAERFKRQLFVEAWNRSGAPDYLLRAGLPAIACQAICVWETGWGSSTAADSGNNLFGVSYYDKALRKWRPERYKEIRTCLDRFVQVLAQERYVPALRVAENPVEFVRALRACGYNAHDSWRDGVIAVMRELSQLQQTASA